MAVVRFLPKQSAALHTDAQTRGNVFQIASHQPQIRLYLPFSSIDFGTANGLRPFAVPNQSENDKYNLIWG